jgi:hypothetical protein
MSNPNDMQKDYAVTSRPPPHTPSLCVTVAAVVLRDDVEKVTIITPTPVCMQTFAFIFFRFTSDAARCHVNH